MSLDGLLPTKIRSFIGIMMFGTATPSSQSFLYIFLYPLLPYTRRQVTHPTALKSLVLRCVELAQEVGELARHRQEAGLAGHFSAGVSWLTANAGSLVGGAAGRGKSGGGGGGRRRSSAGGHREPLTPAEAETTKRAELGHCLAMHRIFSSSGVLLLDEARNALTPLGAYCGRSVGLRERERQL